MLNLSGKKLGQNNADPRMGDTKQEIWNSWTRKGLRQAGQGSKRTGKALCSIQHRRGKALASGVPLSRQQAPPACRKRRCNALQHKGCKESDQEKGTSTFRKKGEETARRNTAQKQYLINNRTAAPVEDNSILHGDTQQHWNEFLLWLITQQQGAECPVNWSSEVCPGISPFWWIHMRSPTFLVVFLSWNTLLCDSVRTLPLPAHY